MSVIRILVRMELPVRMGLLSTPALVLLVIMVSTVKTVSNSYLLNKPQNGILHMSR